VPQEPGYVSVPATLTSARHSQAEICYLIVAISQFVVEAFDVRGNAIQCCIAGPRTAAAASGCCFKYHVSSNQMFGE